MKSVLAAAVCSALVLGTATIADAGRGGSHSRIQNAINSGSTESIIAEVERAERLVSGMAVEVVMGLLDDDRYEVRQVAAWWFAKRPAHRRHLSEQSIERVVNDTDSISVRNSADILGTFKLPEAIGPLAQAAQRPDLTAEARKHVVRALGTIGHREANPALAAAMQDSDASVRLEAVEGWINIRYQDGAAPVASLIADGDVIVRRKAAAAVGHLSEASARGALEATLASDSDPVVRRNAAWALGRIGDPASRAALEAATGDESAMVRSYARAALRNLSR